MTPLPFDVEVYCPVASCLRLFICKTDFNTNTAIKRGYFNWLASHVGSTPAIAPFEISFLRERGCDLILTSSQIPDLTFSKPSSQKNTPI